MTIAVTHNPQNCRPVGELLSQIGSKWTVLVIRQLETGPKRFSELKRALPGVSQKVLTATLRDLERDGMVTRTVTPVIPPRVDYELTELGQDLRGPLATLSAWAFANRERVAEARARFEAREHEH